MRLERDQGGGDVLGATALAKKVSIPLKNLCRRMRLGLVTSFVEAGQGEHAGLQVRSQGSCSLIARQTADCLGNVDSSSLPEWAFP